MGFWEKICAFFFDPFYRVFEEFFTGLGHGGVAYASISFVRLAIYYAYFSKGIPNNYFPTSSLSLNAFISYF